MSRAAEAALPQRLSRRRRVRRVLLAGTLVGLPVLGLALMTGAKMWVDRSAEGHVYAVADAPSVDVTLVLGAGLNPDDTPTPFLAARLDRAIELYRAGRTKVLLVSGDNTTASHDEPTAMQTYLIEHGIPESKIVRDFAGRDSYDSCARAQRIFGVDHLIVVGQSYHLPRAVAICRALGIDAVGVGDDTSQVYEEAWRWGVIREYPANVKAVFDVLTRRDPVLGDPEPGVRDALAAG